MNVWAISDLHLSFARPIRRERYAARWRDHAANIERNWRAVVGPRDLVLLPGDLSMAQNHRDLQPDLAWLERLPGTKVLLRATTTDGGTTPRRSGHCSGGRCSPSRATPWRLTAWWSAERPVPRSLTIRATAAIAAVSRPCEFQKLERALEHAAAIRSTPETPLYVLWHYPPFDAHSRPGPASSSSNKPRSPLVSMGTCIVRANGPAAVQGMVRGVRYHCVAADAIGFRPLRVGTLP